MVKHRKHERLASVRTDEAHKPDRVTLTLRGRNGTLARFDVMRFFLAEIAEHVLELSADNRTRAQ